MKWFERGGFGHVWDSIISSMDIGTRKPDPMISQAALQQVGLAPDQIGFLYDAGHAEALERLGFYLHEEWLKRFGRRIVGTHLHDMIGTTDHYAPGPGGVNFSMIAPYLPENAFRTCEFQTFNTPEQIKAGLALLMERGCIKHQD